LPDVGEGVAEAELIAWHVQVGDEVTTESVLAEVMTDKATVEISSPVSGTVTALRGESGDALAVGGELVVIELVAAQQTETSTPVARSIASAPTAPPPTLPRPSFPQGEPSTRVPATGRSVASPAVRARARSLGIDLATVEGSGPDGRVLHDDLDRILKTGSGPDSASVGGDEPTIEPVRGLRRRIAERLTQSWTQIPHITYVDDVDVTELEELRRSLNSCPPPDGVRLTLLPFLVRALVIACGEQPRLNAHYDSDRQVVSLFPAVHVGIATQTGDGLVVPVLRHAESRSLWETAAEIDRLAGAARQGTANRQELIGSTITITSLGALGGLATTPIINIPEVAIVGVNRLETRPVWRNERVEPRQVMNLSSSFDHRVVDGWDAATFVQRIKSLLETPTLLLADD
jgi:2-oxoisovalerate dehydrogenase E2 component (dihydrolipoyl transacylase)